MRGILRMEFFAYENRPLFVFACWSSCRAALLRTVVLVGQVRGRACTHGGRKRARGARGLRLQIWLLFLQYATGTAVRHGHCSRPSKDANKNDYKKNSWQGLFRDAFQVGEDQASVHLYFGTLASSRAPLGWRGPWLRFIPVHATH